MDWTNLTLGFVSGALAGVIGSAAAVYFTRLSENKKDLAERRHRIYVMLIDLYHQHFWISTTDMHNTEIKREWKEQFQERRSKIIHELRGADKLKQLPEIFDVLSSLDFKTETDRAVRLRQVIDDLAKDVNPNFLAAAKKHDEELSKLITTNSNEWWKRRKKIEPW